MTAGRAVDEDFVGYAAGTAEPDLQGVALPGNARFAVRFQIVLEDWVRPPHLTASDGRSVIDFRAVSAQNYGLRVGYQRLLDVMNEHSCVASVSTTGLCGERSPQLVAEAVRRGHEVVGHAWSHGEQVAYMTEDEDRSTVERTLDALEAASGVRPTGWASGAARSGRHTVRNLLRAGLFHTNDYREADVPFVAGRLGDRRIIALPRTDEINDNYALHNFGHSPSNYVDYFKRSFDRLYRESEKHPGRVLTTVSHGTIMGHPWGAAALGECCAYTRQHADVWQAASGQIAKHYLDNLAA